jgi:hypothetical protein
MPLHSSRAARVSGWGPVACLTVVMCGWDWARDRAAARTARTGTAASSSGLTRATTQQHGTQQGGATGTGGGAISCPVGCHVLIRIVALRVVSPICADHAYLPVTESKNPETHSSGADVAPTLYSGKYSKPDRPAPICYAVTSLTIIQASRARLAAIIGGRWGSGTVALGRRPGLRRGPLPGSCPGTGHSRQGPTRQ